MPDARKCVGTNRDGTPCSAALVPGAVYCRWHDPALAKERKEWSRRGGLAKSNTARAKRRYAEGALDVGQLQGIIGATIVGVLAGRITPGIANAVATLARASVSIRDAAETEERLAALERQAGFIGRSNVA